jgi:hypothetical protein
MQTNENSGRGAAVTLQRREFLALGSAAMVGLAATNLHADVLATISTPMPLLSVGFWNGNAGDLSVDSETAPYRAVVAAGRLAAADASLVRDGARVTVHGFWRAAANRGPLGLALRAQYPGPNGQSFPFTAWSWQRDARVSNAARFTIPVGETLDLAIDRVHRSDPRSLRARIGLDTTRERSETAALSPVSGARGVKLRKGVYFFAIREQDSDAAPSWGSMSVATGASVLDPLGPGVLRARGERAPFSYLVLSVDSARA